MSPRLPPRILALSPGTLVRADGEAFLARLRAAVEAGLQGLLVREPGLLDRDQLWLLERAREILARGWLGVHDRAHLALPVGCDGLHLGFRSLAPPFARQVAGDDVALGFSAHAHDAPGARAGADYLFLGPLHDTPSKRELVPALGLEALAREIERESLPVWAIGGIGPEHVVSALSCGASGVAVLRGILAARDPAAATRRYLAALPARDGGDAR